MTVSEAILAEYDAEVKSTRGILACVPDNKLGWQPHERSSTLGMLVSHIVDLLGWVVPIMTQESLKRSLDAKEFLASSNAELMAAFEKNAAAGREALAHADESTMTNPWSLIVGDRTAFTMPRYMVLKRAVINHVIHHRAQLGVYLRMNDVLQPGMYGPTADDSLRAAKA